MRKEFPKPPGYTPPPKDQPKTLSEEISIILAETLEPHHHADLNVIKFINTFLVCRHAGQAAKTIGLTPYDGKALFKRRDIYKCIQKITELEAVKYGFGAEEVVERVKEIADFDPAMLMNEDGSFIEDLNEMAPEARRVIKKLKVVNLKEKDPNGFETGEIIGRVISYEFWDKLKASELLGREKEIFKEKKIVEHDVGSNAREVLLGAKGRADQRRLALRDVTPGDDDGE